MEVASLDLKQQYQDNRLHFAKLLLTSLEEGDEGKAEEAINELTQTRESYIFQEIGKLTRELHDALGFCKDEKKIEDITQADIPDARQRLNYVITKTEESAHHTMDIIENLLPISDELESVSDTMKQDWQRFTRREMDVAEFRKLSTRLEEFFGTACNNASRIKKDLNELMLSQDYQDLTGQIIRKVIKVVTDVEDKLVNVIRHAKSDTETESVDKNIEAEGPQIDGENNPNVISGQDEVDDLLSSLGF